MSLSDWLRAGAAPAWEQALGQRFVRDVVAGRLPDEVFRRYLRIEFRFVDTAARVLGRTVHVAPSFAARRRLAAGLHDLTTEQFDYFQQVAGRLGLELPAVDAPVPEGARGLHEHFLAVAEDGSYPVLLGCMLGAEWLYATWCDEASRQAIGHSELRAWIQLHTSLAFVGHVAWLRAELDLVGPQLTEPDRRRVLAAFQQTLWAQVPFHDRAYG